MAEPERKRRRPAVSCTLCRKRKIRCNKELPCDNCLRSRSGDCAYDHPYQQRQQPERALQQPLRNIRPATETCATAYATPLTEPGASAAACADAAIHDHEADVDTLNSRIHDLEARLSRAEDRSPQGSNLSSRSTLPAPSLNAFRAEHKSALFGEAQFDARSMVHKSRVFGQSHWANSFFILLQDLGGALKPHDGGGDTAKVVRTISKCKAVARTIKSNRVPQWPTPPTTDLPAKTIADELLKCYLRTFETVYRVLHVPSFKEQYETLWLEGSERDPTFVVKAKLVLALGSLTLDDNFSMRTDALRWIYEAHTWASAPKFKSRIGLDLVQIHIMLVLGREMIANAQGTTWISAGSLIRISMYVGLHRDPARLPQQTLYSIEMRRRLWNTVLEVSMQASLTAGSPMLLSLLDFDTEPPSILEDDELTASSSATESIEGFTAMTIAVELRKSLSLRLAVVRYLNDARSPNTYDIAMRLDRALRDAFKSLLESSRSFQKATGSSNFSFAVAELLMHRYLSALHVPFFERAVRDPSFAFSRKAAIDSALRIWTLSVPSSPIFSSEGLTNDGKADALNLARIVKCGSGLFRTCTIQATVIVALELRAQLLHEGGFGLRHIRRDLLSVLEDGVTHTEQCIAAGETNPKGYLLPTLMLAYIRSLSDGLSKEELSQNLLRTAETASERCLHLLEQHAGEVHLESPMDGLDEAPWPDMGIIMPDFDFMLPENPFDGNAADEIDWIFARNT